MLLNRVANMSEILYTYQNGQTCVTIFSDGTKIRNIEQGSIPCFPESIDVKITNWCDAGCSYCHENSTKQGKHADLQKTVDLLKQLPSGVEIAIGGGHPIAHPDFENFVRELSSHGVICNVTVNETHFQKSKALLEQLISDKCIYGVGYSYSKIPCEWDYENLVNHVIVGNTNYTELEKLTKVCKKVLLLGYKMNTGRGAVYFRKYSQSVENNIQSWYRCLFYAVRKAHISFDNLAIEQLKPIRLFKTVEDYQNMYMGDDGTYTMYMDAVEQIYAKSSTSVNRMPYQESMIDIFKGVRDENY